MPRTQNPMPCHKWNWYQRDSGWVMLHGIIIVLWAYNRHHYNVDWQLLIRGGLIRSRILSTVRKTLSILGLKRFQTIYRKTKRSHVWIKKQQEPHSVSNIVENCSNGMRNTSRMSENNYRSKTKTIQSWTHVCTGFEFKTDEAIKHQLQSSTTNSNYLTTLINKKKRCLSKYTQYMEAQGGDRQ